MKILFITQFFPPEMGAAASRISGLAKNLKKFDHEVTILTGFPNYPSGIIDQKYKHKFSCKEKDEGVIINRVWVFASFLRKFYTRLLNYFSLVFTSILFELFNKRDYDVTIVSSPPLFLGISGYIISRMKGTIFVLDVRDIWPKIGVDTGELKKASIFINIAEKLENFLYKKANLITVVTELKFRYLQGKQIPQSKIKVISNGVDKEFLNVKTDHAVESEYFSSKTFTVLYAGLMGIAQGVEVIIEAATLVRDKRDIRFYIIGEGVEKENLIATAKNFGLKNVKFIENQPKEKIATFLKNSDVSVIPLKRASFSDSVPSKLLESMAFGCPVILSASGESATIVDKANAGLVVEPANPEELATAILKLYDNPELRKQFSENGKRFAKDNFMRDKIAEKLEKVLVTCLRADMHRQDRIIGQ